MRSSPWPSLAITLPLLALAGWAILHLSRGEPQSPADLQASQAAYPQASETRFISRAYLSSKASRGLVWLSFEEPNSGWKREFSLAEGSLEESGELDLEELQLPFQGEVEIFVDARWEKAKLGDALALSLELEPENELSSQTQTFWAEAEASGEASLSFETWQLLLPELAQTSAEE